MMKTSTLFYVYIFTNPIDGIPFYVGKGKSDRYKIHEKEYPSNIEYWNTSKQPIALKDATFLYLESQGLKYTTNIIEELSEQDAFILEQAFIAWFGRRIYGNGVLTNKISGGKSGSLFFDEQALLEIFKRPDLLSHILKWTKYSTKWPARTLFFYVENKVGYPFTEETIDFLYLRCPFEELGAKTAMLLHSYDSVITPLYWVRKVNHQKKLIDDNVYIMHEGLEMIKDFYFAKLYTDLFEKFLTAHNKLKNSAV